MQAWWWRVPSPSLSVPILVQDTTTFLKLLQQLPKWSPCFFFCPLQSVLSTAALVMVNTDNSFRIYFSQVKVKILIITYMVQHKLLLYNFFLLLFYLLTDIDPATLVSLSSRNMPDMILLEGLRIYCSLNLGRVSQTVTYLASLPCSSFHSGVIPFLWNLPSYCSP